MESLCYSCVPSPYLNSYLLSPISFSFSVLLQRDSIIREDTSYQSHCNSKRPLAPSTSAILEWWRLPVVNIKRYKVILCNQKLGFILFCQHIFIAATELVCVEQRKSIINMHTVLLCPILFIIFINGSKQKCVTYSFRMSGLLCVYACIRMLMEKNKSWNS